FPGQDVASDVRPGDPATIWQDQAPDHKVDASITRVAGALDPRTRTLLCEIELDNRGVGFIPGSFSHVRLRIRAPPFPIVPAEALVVRRGDSLVAVVEGERVHFRKITPGVSNGKTMQVTTGLRGGELVALDLPADIGDGAQVQSRGP